MKTYQNYSSILWRQKKSVSWIKNMNYILYDYIGQKKGNNTQTLGD